MVRASWSDGGSATFDPRSVIVLHRMLRAADSAPKPGTGPGNGPQKAENEPQTNQVRGGEGAGNATE